MVMVRDLCREFILFVSHDRQQVIMISKLNSINEYNFNKLLCGERIDGERL